MPKARALENVGLTENEAKVYTALLGLGQATAAIIAGRAEVYRPYAYDTLARLVEKGLVSTLEKKGKRLFQAADPERLVEREEERLEELKKAIPLLKGLQAKHGDETRAELYSGKRIVKVVQEDVLRTLKEQGGDSLVLGVDERRFKEVDAAAMEQFFAKMRRNAFKERVLVRDGDNYLPGHTETTTYRRLPKEFLDPTATFIYGGNVAIVVLGTPLHCLIVRSPSVAKAYRKQFALLWKVAKPITPASGVRPSSAGRERP